MTRCVDLEIVKESIRNVPNFPKHGIDKPEIHQDALTSDDVVSIPVWSLIHFED